MKTIYFTLIVLATSFGAYSQQKEIKVDKFTGDSTITIKEQVIGHMVNEKGKKINGQDIGFYVSKFSKYDAVAIYIVFKPQTVLTAPKNGEIIFKLSNGKNLTYKNERDSEVYSGYKSATIYFQVDKETIKLLSESKITAIRIETSKFPHDYDISPENQDKIGLALLAL